MYPGLDMVLFGACVMAFVILDAIVQQFVGGDGDADEPW